MSDDPRLHVVHDGPVHRDRAYVLYWCRAQRRAVDNLALDHAIARADALALPVLVYEAIDTRYPFANDRMHTFVLEGAVEMRGVIEARGCAYAFYLPRTAEESHASHMLEKLSRNAAMVVTDWYPPAGGPHTLWAHTVSHARRLDCRVEAYDDAAIVPMGLFAKHEIGARTIRPKVHKVLDASLVASHDPSPRTRPPRELDLPFDPEMLTRNGIATRVASCAIDHAVPPVAGTRGGMSAARARLDAFVAVKGEAYDTHRNDMARVVTSGLSPYVHFGHVSARAVAIAARASLPERVRDVFVEELVVRRALAFNHVSTEARHHEYEGIPTWARAQLDAHASDPRPGATDFAHWERGETSDPLWNAAQHELVRDGVIHPYARMLWGKVALTLAATPREAFAWLVALNDRWALDGRDPNTYTNIAWCFGLHDHPYPSRAIYGSVRSMTSRSARHKWDVDAYVARVRSERHAETAGA